MSVSGIPKWKVLLVDVLLVLWGLNVVTSVPAHTMTAFTQRAKVFLDIGWCGLPCVMKNWVHFSSTSPALKCIYYLIQATRQRSLFSVYAQKTIGLLGLEGFEHFVGPVMWHITFHPTSEISIFEVYNLCKVCSRLPVSTDNSIVVFKVNCWRLKSSFSWRQLAFHFQCKRLSTIITYIYTLLWQNVIVQVNYK